MEETCVLDSGVGGTKVTTMLFDSTGLV